MEVFENVAYSRMKPSSCWQGYNPCPFLPLPGKQLLHTPVTLPFLRNLLVAFHVCLVLPQTKLSSEPAVPACCWPGRGDRLGMLQGQRRAERCRGSTSSLPDESLPKRMGNAWALLAFSSGRALVISFSSAQSLFFHRTCSYSMSLKPLYQICRGGFGFFSLFLKLFFFKVFQKLMVEGGK